MAGIEVAGLVLAVIPLFISAFEHYEEGLRPFQRFFYYEQESLRYRTRLLVQYTTYSQTLEYLLTDLTDEEKLSDMIARGYGELWKDPELTTKLQQRLGTAFESVRIVLVQLSDVMEQLARVLDIERQGQITGPQLETLVVAHKPKQALPRQSSQSFRHIYEFKKKLKFSHKGRHIQPLLDALEHHNGQFGRFTETSKKLAKARSKASRRAFDRPLDHVQSGAERLHRVLGGLWTCSQHTRHTVNLILEPRITIPGSAAKEGDPLGSVTFYLTAPSLLPPSVFRSFQVDVLRRTGAASQIQSNVSALTSSANTTVVDVTNLPKVDCLCTTIEAFPSQKCVGFCVDHQERLLSDYPLSQERQNSYKQCSGYPKSLKDILSSTPAGPRRRKPFTNAQACNLGLTVASSFLQLRPTPWLCGPLSAEDVYFVQSTTGPGSLDVKRPFVQQVYQSSPNAPLQANPGNTGLAVGPTAADDKYAFLRLGIMLLEIFSGEPFPSAQNPVAGDPKMADLVSVMDWVEQEKGTMTQGFYNGISECITWFADPRADLQDEHFRQKFIDRLIIPLRDELKIYVPTTKISGP